MVRLTSEESEMIKDAIRRKEYTEAEVARQLGYHSVSSFYRTIDGSRGLDPFKALDLYILLGEEESLRFLPDIVLNEYPSLRFAFEMTSKKVRYLPSGFDKKWIERFQDNLIELRNAFVELNIKTQTSMMGDVESILKKYKPESTIKNSSNKTSI